MGGGPTSIASSTMSPFLSKTIEVVWFSIEKVKELRAAVSNSGNRRGGYGRMEGRDRSGWAVSHMGKRALGLSDRLRGIVLDEMAFSDSLWSVVVGLTDDVDGGSLYKAWVEQREKLQNMGIDRNGIEGNSADGVDGGPSALLMRLEALAVDDGRAGLVVLLLADPHLLEGGQRGEDGASDPDGVFALWGSDDLDLHRRRGQSGDLLLHAIGDSGVHGGSAGQDGVGVQVLTDIDVALHD